MEKQLELFYIDKIENSTHVLSENGMLHLWDLKFRDFLLYFYEKEVEGDINWLDFDTFKHLLPIEDLSFVVFMSLNLSSFAVYLLNGERNYKERFMVIYQLNRPNVFNAIVQMVNANDDEDRFLNLLITALPYDELEGFLSYAFDEEIDIKRLVLNEKDIFFQVHRALYEEEKSNTFKH